MGVPTYITKGLQFVGPTLDAVSASADVFPPLKSAASGALWIVNAVKVSRMITIGSSLDQCSSYGIGVQVEPGGLDQVSDYVAQSVACVAASAAHPRSMERHLNKLLQ